MNKTILTTIALALGMAAAACSSDDDTVKTPLESGTLVCTGATVSTLSFAWEPVEGAIQYTVTLADSEGRTEYGASTNDCALTIEELPDGTEFTASLVAYAPLSSAHSESLPSSVSCVTEAIIPLATPQKFKVVKQGNWITAQWNEVENADYYVLSYGLQGVDPDEVELTTRSYRMSADLPAGEYTFTVTAWSDAEEYGESEPAVATLTL